MSNSVIVSCMMSTSVGVVATAKASASRTAGEPKRAFADMPPMVNIGNRLRSHNTDDCDRTSASDGKNEPAAECERSRCDTPAQPNEQDTEVQNSAEDPAVDTDGKPEEAVAETGCAEQGETSGATQPQESDVDATDTVVIDAAPIEVVDLRANETTQGATVREPSADATMVCPDPELPRGEPATLISAEVSAAAPAAKDTVVPAETALNPLGRAQSEATVFVSDANASVANTTGVDQTLSSAATDDGDAVTMVPQGRSEASDATDPVPQRVDATASTNPEPAEAVSTASGQQVSSRMAERDVRQESTPVVRLSHMDAQGVGAASSDGEGIASEQPGTVSAETPGEIAVAEGQINAGPSTSAGGTTPARSELHVESHEGQSPPVEAHVSLRATDTPPAEGLFTRSPVQDVGDQILESVHASLSRGDRQIEVRLNPPELGSVTVRFQEHDGQITGLLEVSKDQTRHEVEQALPQVIRGMQESGLLIRRLDVVITDQQEGDLDLDREALFQDGWAQQDGSNQQDAQAGRSSIPRWDQWTITQEGALEQGGASPVGVAARNRINILL